MQKRFQHFLFTMTLFLGAGGVLGQNCAYDSIPATAPSSRFTDNVDGTVTDKATGLMWKRCPERYTWNGSSCTRNSLGSLSWPEALQLADEASFAGWTDWRLPNIKELASLVERACYEPAINLEVFPYPAGQHWSSTPDARGASQGLNCPQRDQYCTRAWGVDFTDGVLDQRYYYDDWGVARLVRGGF